MSTWTLIQTVIDIFLATGLFTVVMRLNRAPKDDPRLSRGLQLLQSKISVLEDLSDRTEVQVQQMTALLESKAREVQAKIQLAEQHVHEIRVSMQRSLEVAKIFQDKIPHQEIIERQNTIKYVQAARLAHQGFSVEQIGRQVDLPKGEIEFIASVNRERLMFSEDQLPQWAIEAATAGAPQASRAEVASQSSIVQESERGAESGSEKPFQSFALPTVSFAENPESSPTNDSASRLRAEMELAEHARLVENLSRLQFEMQNLDLQLAKESAGRDLSGAFEVPKVETATLQRLGEQFRQAVNDAKEKNQSSLSMAAAMGSPAVENASRPISEEQVPGGQGQRDGSLQPEAFAQQKNLNERAEFTQQEGLTQSSSIESAREKIGPSVDASVQDPSLARIAAAAQLKAALKATAKPSMDRPPVAPNADLLAARALAREAAAPQPLHVINGRGVRSAAPEVKKVIFPKIDKNFPF